MLFSLLLALLPAATFAVNFVNLTPKPLSMTVGEGRLVLPQGLTVSTQGMPDTLAVEAQAFVEALNQATGLNAQCAQRSGKALVKMVRGDKKMNAEGYELVINKKGVVVKARTSAGFFYGFQTLKKLLPANVMAGVKDATVSEYALPLVTVKDAPRFAYRGFMLDVSRHFFSADEVKKMLRVMAAYKLNRFHWHLTDDQGWRLEIKKYPELTRRGATRQNSYMTDMKTGPYWTNRQDGPFYYTQEQVRDVVAYAKRLHIEVIPEIDMPGHFCAAMAAYPEFSCTPKGQHNVWTGWGVSEDVLNVANPGAVQFAKDVLSEVMDMFPYKRVHIGGDECPTKAWEKNEECQALYKAEGLTSYRQLHSRFIKQMADFMALRGYETDVWNEAITAEGVDLDSVKAAGVGVYAWYPAKESAKKAAENGLNTIYTEFGPYYINRKQSTAPGEPSAAGDGKDNLKRVYTTVPVPAGLTPEVERRYIGIQGTFWTEHVGDNEYMEYLALPRLLAIAEAGWTPERLKNYDDFVRRASADQRYFDLAGYNYCKHDLNK